MIIGVPRETLSGERRVGLVAESVERLVKSGLTVILETGAGEACGRSDAKFTEAGGRIAGADEVLGGSDIIVKVRPPEPTQVARLREGGVLISLLDPVVNGPLLELLAARRVTALALERIPRVARAQSMDVLSSMSTISVYKSALIAADRLPRFFPMLMSAAGSIQPARVLVIGAGVAGLQAIATARRLGARVEAFDPRPAAREQVESLGARFVGAELLDASVETAGGYAREQTEEERAKQREALKACVALSDVVICSALVAGRKAPLILDEAMVRSMAPGSVIVDLAAEQGGNCALTVAAAEVERHGVLIVGPVNIPSLLPYDASRMFSRNVCNLLNHLVRKGEMIPLVEDEIACACLASHGGQVWADGRPLAAAGSAAGPS